MSRQRRRTAPARRRCGWRGRRRRPRRGRTGTPPSSLRWSRSAPQREATREDGGPPATGASLRGSGSSCPDGSPTACLAPGRPRATLGPGLSRPRARLRRGQAQRPLETIEGVERLARGRGRLTGRDADRPTQRLRFRHLPALREAFEGPHGLDIERIRRTDSYYGHTEENMTISMIAQERHRRAPGSTLDGVGDRLFEALGGPVHAVGTRRLSPADLLHLAGELDHVAVGIAKLQAHVAARPAASLEHELDPLLSEEFTRLEEIVHAAHLERHVVKRQVLVLGGEGGFGGTRNEPERVVIRAVAEEDHAELITVGLLEPQDVRVELDGPLDVRNVEQDMADLARANRCRHDVSFRPVTGYLFHHFQLSS